LDEVLPRKESQATPVHSAAAEQLRFLRNLGMRVVMAGTAATAANMIGVANPSDVSPASRSGKADVGWMEIHFLYTLISFRQGSLHEERPWVATYLEEMENNR
jgi:hypothetical protein